MVTRSEWTTPRDDSRTCNTLSRAGWIVALALALATGAGCYDEALGLTEQPIIGGRPEAGHAAVVALVGSQGAFCSGTLVRPTVVVTAAHCLEGASASGLSVFFGSDATRPGSGQLIPAAGVDYHPSYNPFDVSNDIGVVTLAYAASATPIDVQSGPMSGDWVGRQAVFVGFGTTNPVTDGGGVKFAVSIPITDVSSTTFTYSGRGVNTCYGDSGGPAFYTDGNGQTRLIGVTSWGDEDCASFGVDTRVDAFTSYLQPFLDGQAAPAGDAGGAPADDYCADAGWYGDGWCDEDCPSPDPDCGDTGDGGAGGEPEGEDPWEVPDTWPGDYGCSAAGAGGTWNGLLIALSLVPLLVARRRRSTA